MNRTQNRTATTILGSLMVTVALGAGAYFGNLTSPDAPAQAQTVEDACSVLCLHQNGATLSGGGGNLGAIPTNRK